MMQQQQQMPEQNQMGCQQTPQQQMVLCPVRVVYETQMLMQPGENMQPNQTIFINPQNPPPWAQNRPVQNQVIYVQQIPGNYMHSIQQHMDPNQLYFQQAYQQIIQQPMISQSQDMRQYQVNMVPSNMVQTAQNVGHNVQSQVVQQNDRISQSNYLQVPHNVGLNTQISNANSPQVVKPQNVNAQAIQNQQMISQRPVHINTGQQTNQHPNIARPQLITVNPMQQANVQAINQVPTNHIPTNAQVMQPVFASTIANPQMVNSMVQTEARMRRITPNNGQTPTNMRNFGTNYVYRPIQPRPQFRPNMPNVSVQNTMQQTPNVINLQPIQPNINPEVRKTNDEVKSRKRKSESPDELSKKVTIVNINTALSQNPMKTAEASILNLVKSVDIGVNTSPIHRPKNKSTISNNDASVNTNPVIFRPSIPTSTVTSNDSKVNTMPISYQSKIPTSTITSNDAKINTIPISYQSKMPITHNDPKASINKIESMKIPNNSTPPSDSKLNSNQIKDVKSKEALKTTDNTSPSDKDKEMKTNLETNAGDKIRYTVFPQARTKRTPKDEFNKVNVNILKDTKNILYSTDEKNEFKFESRSLLKEKILSRTDNKKEGEKSEVKNDESNDTKSECVKEVKEYVLTHVLDGIVIQESNTAFPIREPTRVQNSAEKKRDVVKVDDMLKGNCLQLPISDLKLQEEGQKEEPATEERDNPFNDLKTATVKSWTVDELCSHLTKYKWEECVSLLQEHEIDGESLYLVTKQQLLQIGVKEKCADVICEFVKS